MTIKLNAATLSHPIQYIVNLSINSKKFCNKWKIARVIPLHKGGKLDPNLPSSYRPISILSATSKIAEKAIQEQLNTFMDKSKQWNKNSHAYKTNHNTTTALMELFNTLERLHI